MLLRRRPTAPRDDENDVVLERGPSLAKGPALVAGALLVAFGLTGLLTDSTFPTFSDTFPDGTVQGSSWLGLEVNGWTCFFAIAGGALLMFGAAQHHLAKTMSLLVGLAFAACAVIAIIDGEDVLGLAAANGWTKLGFAVAGGAMLLNALMPRTTRRRRRPMTGASQPAAERGVAADEEPTRTDLHRRQRFARDAEADDGVRDDGENATTAPAGGVADDPPRAPRRA